MQATIQRSRTSGAISSKVLLWLGIPLCIILLVLGLLAAEQKKQIRKRTEWKAQTLPQLAELSITNETLADELEILKTGIKVGERRWVGEHVLLMTNGEYLIYASRHGFNNGWVDHLFLAHGPNNRWLYSTYHFCNSMVMLLSDEPPGSISEFQVTYAAKEFDGKSDECLKHTWPVSK